MTESISSHEQAASEASVSYWRLVTNHENMLFMLAAGMVMSPAGFGQKYYKDTLKVDAGWIPLFRDQTILPAGILSSVTEERKHLAPCVALFELKEFINSRNEEIDSDQMPRQPAKKNSKSALWVPAPMPLGLQLKGICFKTEEDLNKFKNKAQSVSNISISALSDFISVKPEAFKEGKSTFKKPMRQGDLLNNRKPPQNNPPAYGQALGGALVMLYLAANRSLSGLAAYKRITGTASPEDEKILSNFKYLASLPDWFTPSDAQGDKTEDISDDERGSRLIRVCVQAMIQARIENQSVQDVDAVIKRLTHELSQFTSSKLTSELQLLLDDMQGCYGIGNVTTINDLLDRHKTPPRRALLMFCLRQRCDELCDFTSPKINEEDYILASILFGVRETWLGLPMKLRPRHIENYVIHAMAAKEHEANQTGGKFGQAPSRPRPLLERFTLLDNAGDLRQNEGARTLAHECQWTDCIWTHLSGVNQASIKPDDKGVVVPGYVKPTYSITPDTFLKHLNNSRGITAELDAKIQDLLNKEEEGSPCV